MASAYKIITPVSTNLEPVSLQDAKDYLRVDFSDEDNAIQGIITRARAFVETIMERALATQQIQEIFTIARPTGGELSGPVNEGPNWYQYQEQLGANPFGAAQFYFDLARPPIQVYQPITVQTRVTVFDNWEDFSGLYTIDDTQEPARMYFQIPVTANQWKFTFWAGYDATNSYPIPPDILQCVYETIAHFYQNREAQDVPGTLQDKMLRRRSDWI